MSDTVELIKRLQGLDIHLKLDGDRLSVNAPKGAVTPELREELGRRKDEVKAFLAEQVPEYTPEMFDAAIARITPQPIAYVVICSEHGDHTGGNAAFKAAFPNVVFISSPASQKALAKNANPPTETVADKRTVKLGNTAVDILNLGRSHTGGDLAVQPPHPQ